MRLVLNSLLDSGNSLVWTRFEVRIFLFFACMKVWDVFVQRSVVQESKPGNVSHTHIFSFPGKITFFFFFFEKGLWRGAAGGRVRVEPVGKSLAMGVGSVSVDLHCEQAVCGWCQLCALPCPDGSNPIAPRWTSWTSTSPSASGSDTTASAPPAAPWSRTTSKLSKPLFVWAPGVKGCTKVTH